jgi:hypothetical protein
MGSSRCVWFLIAVLQALDLNQSPIRTLSKAKYSEKERPKLNLSLGLRGKEIHKKIIEESNLYLLFSSYKMHLMG